MSRFDHLLAVDFAADDVESADADEAESANADEAESANADEAEPEPESDASLAGGPLLSLSARVEHSAYPMGREQIVFALVTVQAAARLEGSAAEQRQPMDLVCVLDVSGSMAERQKLRQLQDAARFVVQQAAPRDRLSLVAFNSRATRVLPLRRMTAKGKSAAITAVLRLAADGGTSIAAGLREAVRTVEERRRGSKVSAIMLLTDGQDQTPACEITTLLRRAAVARCAVYAFGFGRDHDANMLGNLAEQARTPFTFVEDTSKIGECFAGTIGGLSSTVAQMVKLRLTCHARLMRVHSPFLEQHNEREVDIEIPDMFASERRDILVEVQIPAEARARVVLLEAAASYVDARGGRRLQTKPVAVETHSVEEPCAEAEPDEEVSAQRARVEVAQALRDAATASDRGRFDEASQVIDACETRMGTRKRALPASAPIFQELEDARTRMQSRAAWEEGGRAETLDATQMHTTQRCTNTMRGAGSHGKRAKDIYCSATQRAWIESSRDASSLD